ncbi:hypothetical protein NQZ68_015158, partial [Dissostichus eleginoides]
LCCLPAAISPPQAPEPIFLTRHSFYELSLLTVLLGVLVRSLSHRPPELPANLPASSFTIPACLVLSPA